MSTNRSLIFSRHLDSAPFKDFNVEVEMIQKGLQHTDLWLNRDKYLPIEPYEKQELITDGNIIKGNYAVFSSDNEQVELRNNSRIPEIKTLKGDFELHRNDLVSVTYDLETDTLIHIKKLTKKDVTPQDILPTSTDIVRFRDELVYYISLTDEDYQTVMMDILTKVWKYYKEVPGSQVGHHVYLGGLLEHVVEDIRIAKTILELPDYKQSKLLGDIYKLSASVHWGELEQRRKGTKIKTALHYMVNDFYQVADAYLTKEGSISFNDVVLTYVVHDLGKVVETSYLGALDDRYEILNMGSVTNKEQENEVFFGVDTVGGSFGHSLLSILMLNSLENKPELDYVYINRLVATHHFKAAFGSIKQAETKSEYFIHMCDKIGALFCAEQYY